MSGHAWRISSTSSSDSSRDRMMRLMPMVCQKRTAAKLVVLACTDRCTAISGQRSRTSMIKPGSAMISASGASAMTGSRSSMKVRTLALWG